MIKITKLTLEVIMLLQILIIFLMKICTNLVANFVLIALNGQFLAVLTSTHNYIYYISYNKQNVKLLNNIYKIHTELSNKQDDHFSNAWD